MAYAPLVLGEMGVDEHGLGYIFLGWGILLAITSVFVAPILKEKFGTVKSMSAMLFLFSLCLLAMGIWTDSKLAIIISVVVAGALLGNNNTLITAAVMNAAPVERSTASAAYSCLRFIGGAIVITSYSIHYTKLYEISYRPSLQFGKSTVSSKF